MPHPSFARRIRSIGTLLLLIGGKGFADSTTQPATQPTVDTVLSAMDAAYSQLSSAQFAGHITGDFNINGQVTHYDQQFTSNFTAPNKFRHQATDDVLIGSTGKNVFAYLAGRDEYQTSESPKTRVASSDWPAVVQLLADQNPSLLLAISASASAELKELSKNITLQPATEIDGIACDVLRLDVGDDHDSITLLVDPSTHLIREMRTDRTHSTQKSGAIEVKSALIVVDYTQTVPNAPVDGSQFAWTPPANAVQVSATPAAMASAAGSEDHKQLIGKTAPDFTLRDLQDKSVTLSKQKGSVVVLDFWATWCGPCVMSLPHLDELYKQQSPNGLKVFALDQREDHDKVAEFVKSKGWSIPVLLDSDGAVAAKYKVTGIPQTVVVGKDGKIKQIFVGSGHEKDIAAVVAKAMAE